jgi:hypothetical protein
MIWGIKSLPNQEIFDLLEKNQQKKEDNMVTHLEKDLLWRDYDAPKIQDTLYSSFGGPFWESILGVPKKLTILV